MVNCRDRGTAQPTHAASPQRRVLRAQPPWTRPARKLLPGLSYVQLNKRGLAVEAQVPVPLVYDGQQLLDVGYRIDILVERELVIEIKSIEAIAPVHRAQLLSYLRLSGRRLGLLLNFNVELLRDGIVRRVNRL